MGNSQRAALSARCRGGTAAADGRQARRGAALLQRAAASRTLTSRLPARSRARLARSRTQPGAHPGLTGTARGPVDGCEQAAVSRNTAADLPIRWNTPDAFVVHVVAAVPTV